MANKKLLYLEDLYDFYSSKYKRSTHFSSAEHGSPIVVQVHGTIKFDSENKDTEGLYPVHLQACHTGLNINQSNIDDSVMEANLNSFKNRPILGYIHKVVTDENPDGQWEFYSHNMHEDENGDIVYDEVPIGLIPESCNAQIVYDEDKKKNYVEVDGYLFEEYSKAVEILEREQECAVSVELSIRELSYNAREKYLNIEDFWFSGVTILGKTPSGKEVHPGMQGSNIKLADFSEKNNSFFADYSEQINQLQQKVDALLSRFNIDDKNLQEGGNNSQMNKFEELLKKYNKTVEDITFDYSNMSDEDLETKFAELFGDNSEDNTNNSNTDDDSQADNGNFEKMVRSYELSHSDIRYALYNLLSPVESADNEWYFINSVYDSHFTYENWEGTKIYGQNYTKDGDNVAFDGERYNLHRELLTDSEYAELQSMRSNYASLVEFKETAEKNELHAQREAVLDDEKYSVLAAKDEAGNYTNASYAKLYSEMDNYSVEDLEKEVKILLGEYALNGGKFEAIEEKQNKQTSYKLFTDPNKKGKKTSKYGNLKFHKEN